MNKLEKIERKEIESYKKKTEAKKKVFLTENKIGLILSSKPGQKNKAIEIIKEKIENLGKNVYIFEADNINVNEFENFPQIKIWVNTACYGMARDDKRIINLADILEFFN
jgi:diphthamide biosynthesis enzyme Dph1/Dph2-like protein